MLLDQQKETLDQIVLNATAYPTGAASQPGLALAPLRVQAFHDTGLANLATIFVNGPVLLRREETLVGWVAVGDDGLVVVISRHIGPAQRKRRSVPLTKGEAQHLPHLA